MLTIPWSGCSRPATRRKVVVLPAPLGPSSTKNSPLPIDRERSSTASTSRKRLVTPLRVTSAMGHFLAHDERAFAGQQPLRMAVVEQRALDAEGEADGRVKRHDGVLVDTHPHSRPSSSRTTCSGRTPRTALSQPCRQRDTGTAAPASRTSVAPGGTGASTGRKFIGGLPMKEPTKTVSGR